METVFKLKMLKSGPALASDSHKEKPFTDTLQNEIISAELMRKSFVKLESWLPFMLQCLLGARTNEEFENLLRYMREYISYSNFDIPTLENIESSLNCSRTEIEKSLAIWTDIVHVKWPGQSHYQALLGHLFFPVQYENCYETLRLDHLQALICISASHGNLLALYYATKLVELYAQDNHKTVTSVTTEALALVRTCLERGSVPFYFAGLLCQSMNKAKKATELFKAGFEKARHPLCGYRYAMSLRDVGLREGAIHRLQELSPALAQFAIVSFMDNTEPKVVGNEEAGNAGIAQGYLNAGILLEETDRERANELFLKSARCHLTTAFEKLADWYEKNNDSAGLKHLCQRWIHEGDPLAFIKLGEHFLKNGSREEALQCFKQAGIRGIEKQIEYADSHEIRESIKPQLTAYAGSMITFIKLKIKAKREQDL